MRLSTYSILSDRLSNGDHVLFNGINGLFDIVPASFARTISDVIERRQDIIENEYVEKLKNEISSVDWNALVARGHLTELSDSEERNVVIAIADATHFAASEIPTIMIVPNLDCNYRCSYCFERPLQNEITAKKKISIKEIKKVVLDHDQIDRIFDCMDILRSRASRFPGEITLYGGEPLDVENLNSIEYIVKKGSEFGIAFSAITNGHDLPHFLHLLAQDKIRRVQISFDGPRDTHNRTRLHAKGLESFDVLIRNIELALSKTQVEFHLRCHLDSEKIEEFEELISFFASKGWMNNSRFLIYAHTVYEKSHGSISTSVSFDDIKKKWHALSEYYSNLHLSAPEYHSYKAVTDAIMENARAKISGVYCSANVGSYIFCPDDAIYACWESIGKSCSRIGTYSQNGMQMNESATKKWFSRSIATLEECQKCAYALVCGGGCAQYAEYNHGTVNHSYCDGFQETFRAALAKGVADMVVDL